MHQGNGVWRESRKFLLFGLVASVAIALVSIISSGVSAFVPFPIEGSFQGLKTHPAITKEAMREVLSTIFPGTAFTEGVKFAVDDVVMANIFVDFDQYTASLHADGESINEAHRRILDRREEIVAALTAAKDAVAARVKLGQALHTLQDFYSHSNYIESSINSGLPIGLIPPLTILGRKEVPNIPFVARVNDPTCDSLTHSVLEGVGLIFLTTGYYGGEDRRPPKDTPKCHHGGGGDSLGRTGIHKDSPFVSNPVPCTNSNSCSISSLTERMVAAPAHAQFHGEAARVAQLATREFIEQLLPDVGVEGMRLLLGLGTLELQYTNRTSSAVIQLSVDGEDPQIRSLSFPGEHFFYEIPPLVRAGDHVIVVQGLSSTSPTGLIFYKLRLPSHLEFVEYSSNLPVPPIKLSGQEAGFRFLLRPIGLGGLREVEHRIIIRVRQ